MLQALMPRRAVCKHCRPCATTQVSRSLAASRILSRRATAYHAPEIVGIVMVVELGQQVHRQPRWLASANEARALPDTKSPQSRKSYTWDTRTHPEAARYDPAPPWLTPSPLLIPFISFCFLLFP